MSCLYVIKMKIKGSISNVLDLDLCVVMTLNDFQNVLDDDHLKLVVLYGRMLARTWTIMQAMIKVTKTGSETRV